MQDYTDPLIPVSIGQMLLDIAELTKFKEDYEGKWQNELDRANRSEQIQRQDREMYNGRYQAIKELVLEKLESEDIDNETAQEIADIFGFSLSKEYDVTIDVQYTFSVSLPVGENINDALDSFDVPDLYISGVEMMNENSEVINVDWSEVS